MDTLRIKEVGGGFYAFSQGLSHVVDVLQYKFNSTEKIRDFKHALKVIQSCENVRHESVAINMIKLFWKKHRDESLTFVLNNNTRGDYYYCTENERRWWKDEASPFKRDVSGDMFNLGKDFQ